ncbi:MAG: NAD-dependent epimerase/dehydratase family protein [Proteobacteria bacterium]|nr:NAD-dependent epimerase/dehydratase family protein [Pseudomonadota bacterium]
MSRRVLVTHADEAIGRRLVARLHADDRIEHIVAAGAGPPPRRFDRIFSADDRLTYHRLDLTRHRSVRNFFGAPDVREPGIDAVIHLPRLGEGHTRELPLMAGVAERTAEARLVLQQTLEAPRVRTLVALSSAFVYRLGPGNANRLDEDADLDLDPTLPPETRAWVDCDMLFHAEMHATRCRIVLLRVPTVVGPAGQMLVHPGLTGAGWPRPRPLGFDPLCALVTVRDVARALHLSLFRGARGVYNVAGAESLPLSQLSRAGAQPSWPVPGPLLQLGAWASGVLGREDWAARWDGAHLRHGFTLDTARAERELGFRPADRIGLAQDPDGRLRLEASPHPV